MGSMDMDRLYSQKKQVIYTSNTNQTLKDSLFGNSLLAKYS